MLLKSTIKTKISNIVNYNVANLFFAMIISVILIYMILVILFNSYSIPIIIFSILPFGIAGSVIYLTDVGKYITVIDLLPSEGFMGISVALLGFSTPIGVFLAGLFFGYLKVGGQYMQLYDFSFEIITIITGFIVYFSALIVVFQSLARKWFRLRKVVQ